MSRYAVDIGKENLDVTLGFDEGIMAYWLVIEDVSKRTDSSDFYIFHNINDVPGSRMTLSQVEAVLSQNKIALPHDLACTLVKDGRNAGYLSFLEESGGSEYDDFMAYCVRLDSSSSGIGRWFGKRKWNAKGKLPKAWW